MPRISDNATTEPSAVPLVIAIVRLVSGGMVRRSACGSTTLINACPYESPVERAASHWPFGIEMMPAQKISSENAINTSVSESQVETKLEGDMPAAGRPK